MMMDLFAANGEAEVQVEDVTTTRRASTPGHGTSNGADSPESPSPAMAGDIALTLGMLGQLEDEDMGPPSPSPLSRVDEDEDEMEELDDGDKTAH